MNKIVKIILLIVLFFVLCFGGFVCWALSDEDEPETTESTDNGNNANELVEDNSNNSDKEDIGITNNNDKEDIGITNNNDKEDIGITNFDNDKEDIGITNFDNDKEDIGITTFDDDKDNSVNNSNVYNGNIIYLGDNNFSQYCINGKEYVCPIPCIIDYGADWCQWCKKQEPILERIQKKYGSRLQIFHVDVDESPKAANKFKAQALPTLIFINKSGKAHKEEGYLEQSQVEKLISQYCGVK